MVALLTEAFKYNYRTTNLQRQRDARWRVHRTQGVSIMMEVFPVIVILGLLGGIISDVVQPAATYAIDQGKQGVEYIEEKLN